VVGRGIDSSSENSDISPNSSFNCSFRLAIVKAPGKLWALMRPLPLYRSLDQRYVSGLVKAYTHAFSNQRVSTPVVFFLFGVGFGFPNQQVSTPVVLFLFGVGSGFPISGYPLQWFFFLFGVSSGFPMSGYPLQWFFFLTVSVLVRFSNPGCGAIVLENLAGRLLPVK